MISKRILFAFALIALGACDSEDDPIQGVDRSTDCADICNAYKDCISTDYDVDRCADRCSDMDTDTQSNKIDRCENCLDDQSCVDSVFKCTAECAGIVP